MLFNLKNKTKKEIICFGTKPFGKQAPFDYLKIATYILHLLLFTKRNWDRLVFFFVFFLSKRLLLIL